jgi:hypothetical protein
MKGRRVRKHNQLLDDSKEKRGYWNLKEEVVDCTLEKLIWRRLWTSLKTAYWMNVRLTGFYRET